MTVVVNENIINEYIPYLPYQNEVSNAIPNISTRYIKLYKGNQTVTMPEYMVRRRTSWHRETDLKIDQIHKKCDSRQ